MKWATCATFTRSPRGGALPDGQPRQYPGQSAGADYSNKKLTGRVMNSIIRFRDLAFACFAVLLLAGAARAQFLPGGDETTMSSSGIHACAITAGGRVKCWGSNQERRLGNNSVGNSNRPVNVLAPDGVGLFTILAQRVQFLGRDQRLDRVSQLVVPVAVEAG